MFARQDQYRSFNLDQTAVTTATVTWGQTTENQNELTLDIPQTAVPLETASTISWAPYLYDDLEAAWKSYPIEQYWEFLGAKIAAGMLAEFVDPEAAGGATFLAQTYYVALIQGISNIVQIAEQQLQTSYYHHDRPLAFSIANGSKAIGVLGVKILLEHTLTESNEILQIIFNELNSAKRNPAANPLGATGRAIASIFNKLKSFGLSSGAAIGAMVLITAAIIIGVSFLVAEALGEDTGGPARIALATIVGAVTFYAGVVAPLMQASSLVSTFRLTGQAGITLAESAASAWTKAAKSMETVTKGAKYAAGLGLLLAIGISWTMFGILWDNGTITPGSVAFNTVLAQTLAATIIALIQFALSLTIIGAIIVALFGIVDLLLFILGVNFSLNGWFTEQLGKFIYHFELTVDADIDTGEPNLTLTNPNRGMAAGATIAATMPITTTITHNDPDDFWGWRVLPYLPPTTPRATYAPPPSNTPSQPQKPPSTATATTCGANGKI